MTDFLWVRVLDVPRVLGERTYERDGSLVIEVTDTVEGASGPAAGRFRLEAANGAATCAPTKTPADLTFDVRHLSAAVLGGTRLLDAARGGGVVEHRPGALAAADRLFRMAGEPWCTTWF